MVGARTGRMSQTYVDLSEIPMSEVDELQAKVRLTRIPFTHGPDHILYFDEQETIEDMIKLQLHGKKLELDKD